jgi:hypothetical protein
MKIKSMKKFLLTTLTLTALTITLTFVFPIKDTAGVVASAATSAQTISMPPVNVFALDNNSTLYVLRP